MISGYELFEGKFQTRDQFNLHYRYFKKAGARGTLFLLHGHGEHSGRYLKFASHLKDENLSLAMYDMRGYGLSDGEACYVDSYYNYTDDFSDFLEFSKKEWGIQEKPLVLGHSNGGLVAVHWALKNPNGMQVLFLSSPYLGLKLPAPLILLNHLIYRISPHFAIAIRFIPLF